MALEHEVIIACDAQDRQKCVDIRFQVFHKEQKFSADVEIDEYDTGDKATHFLLRLTPSQTPVGTIRCVKLAPLTYKLTRLAVLKDYRNQHLGRYLVLALHDWVQQQALLELIDSTPTNSTNDSEQMPTTSSSYPMAHTNADHHHPDQDLTNFGSISSNIRNTPRWSSAKIIIHSQIPVEGFYARFGYQAEGEQFDEDGEPHRKMVLQLPLRQLLHVN